MISLLAASTLVGIANFLPPILLPEKRGFPDPLELADGSSVTSREVWFNQRVPELRKLFENYEYGRYPAPTPVHATVVTREENALGGQALLREVQIDLGLERPVSLLVITPVHRAHAPCFLCLNYRSNSSLLQDAAVPIPETAPGEPLPMRGAYEANWSMSTTIARGYAIAVFCTGDVVPDNADGAKQMLRHWHPLTSIRGGNDTGTLMAWAWGASRMLDYLQTLPEIDPKRIAIMGHSRDGKAALVAAAFDSRFALVIASQSGCGGAAPSRQESNHPLGETLAQINDKFPWWFAINFHSFNQQIDRLPFDQHELIALCAPRPVLLSCATEDAWSNPSGQFSMLHEADPVYRLVSAEGLEAEEMPPSGQLIASRLGYFIRPGKHSVLAQDWAAWLDYADKWL
ncbi:MAG: hypothetical protein LV479_11570 [Methylacidiphilales bacterium]|nr:hypothetical protein [Candidatus Methylacidiphilales bacterium]